jgi:hypothetical protein
VPIFAGIIDRCRVVRDRVMFIFAQRRADDRCRLSLRQATLSNAIGVTAQYKVNMLTNRQTCST